MRGSCRIWFASTVYCLTIIACATSLCADEDDLRLAAGLRERRLFDQAEFVCRQALSALSERVDLPASGREQVAFVVELIRIRSDQARFAAPDQRQSFRLAAREMAERFLKDYPKHPRRIIIQLQSVLIDSDLVNLIGQEQDFGVGSESDRQRALELSQVIRAKLRSIDREIADQLQSARNESATDSASLSVKELTALQRNVQFHIAIAGLQRAKLYGKSDEQATLNRTSALSEVLQQLSSLQRANEPGSDLWWQTQLALVKCDRLLGDVAKAQTMLDRTRDADLSRYRRKWHESILAEQAELLLAAGMSEAANLKVAQSVLLAIDQRSVASARLDWLALNLVTAMNDVAASDSKQQEHLSQAKRRADLIARQHGPWWGLHAKQLISGSFGGAEQGGEVASRYGELVQKGQAAMAANQFAEAQEAFGQAAAIAKRSNDRDAWRSCQVSASRALEQLGRHRLAANKLLETANEEPAHSASASIHLRGIWNLAQTVSSTDEGRTAYVKALGEHLERWPDSKTADQAKLWLGEHQFAEGQFASAAETLLAVSKNSNHRVAAVRSAADALTKLAKSESPEVEKVLNTLVEERPRDVAILLAQARVSARLGLEDRPVRVEHPLALWRGLARRLKPETDQWFEAKYNVARLLVAAGEKEKAAQLMNYLAALPAGWSKSSFVRQLNDLQRSIQSKPSPN
ncbi:hypothetical protein N9L06_05205 [Mariniblastus sp.]|nr:hypothetical protein [Mariniblastus sp.]